MKKVLRALFILALIYFIYKNVVSDYNESKPVETQSNPKLPTFETPIETQKSKNPELVIAMTACETWYKRQTKALIRSALMFESKDINLKFLIFTDASNFVKIQRRMVKLERFFDFSYELREASFPEYAPDEWKSMYSSCSSLRLFLPSMFPKIDNLLYVDADTIFLSSPHETFDFFYKFNPTQIIGMAPESEQENFGIYKNETRASKPFYGKSGLSSGVMLMNLTRMRELKFEEELFKLFTSYQKVLSYADQDLLNIYFSQHSDQVYVLPCDYNFREEHCMDDNLCFFDKGIKLIHGSQDLFNHADSIFGSIYDAFVMYKLEDDPCENIIQIVANRIVNPESFNGKHKLCNLLIESFLRIPKEIWNCTQIN